MKTIREHNSVTLKVVILLVLFFKLISLSFGADPKIFNLYSFNGALVFQYQRTIEEEYIFDDLIQDINRNYFEGGVELNFEGSIYHPNLLTFRVDLNLVANKTRNLYFSDEYLNNSLNNTYNINLHFLKKKTTNLQLYAEKNYSTADRRFSERFFMSTNRYGLKLVSSNKLLPLMLDIYRRITLSESISYPERDEQSDNVELKGNFSKISGGRSMFRLKARDYSERVFNSDYKSLNLVTDFLKYYGRGKRNSIFSLFSFRKMTGDIDQEVFRFDVTHRQYLSGILFFLNSYRFVKDNTPNKAGEQHLLGVSLHHQLFDSLNTKLSAGGRFENYIFQKIDALSYNLEFNYRKKIKSGGINITYFLNREKGDYTSKSDIASVSESFSFSISETIVLTTPGISIDSIRLTDNDLMELYVDGVDYQIEILDSIVTINRMPGGAIPASGKIIVSYEFLSFPDYNFIDTTRQFNLNLNVFKYIHFFFRSGSKNQNISSDFLITPFQNYSKNLTGIKFLSKSISSEYSLEDYDSDSSSYVSKNFRLSLGFNITRNLRLTGSTTINRLEYDSKDYYVNFDTYYGSLNFRPNHFIYINLIYRDMNYETQNYFRNRESLIGKFQWNFRKIVFEFFYEYILNEFGNLNKSRNHFILRLRRMF